MNALSVRDVCERTSLSRRTVERAIDAGELIARRHGRRVVVLDLDLDAWLESLPSARTEVR